MHLSTIQHAELDPDVFKAADDADHRIIRAGPR